MDNLKLREIKYSIVTLIEDIGEQISAGWQSVNKLQNLSFYLTNENDFYNEEHDMEELIFKSKIERLHISFCTLIEALNMPFLLEQYKSDFLKLEENYTKLDILPYIGELHSEALDLFWQYHKTLSALVGHNVQDNLFDERMSQFERILINTPKIVTDRGVEPNNEAQVRKCVYELLIHIFPDTVKEIPISQETKTYKPDLGVKSLKVAAEYKFADSAEEVKKAVGGLYEDMRGYAGSEDWKHFYAVVYMTDAYFTPEQIMSEFNHTDSDDNWKPILVFGKGYRKKKNV